MSPRMVLWTSQQYSGPGGNVFYSGLMDEPTIYNRALTLNEIFGIYSADFVGKDYQSPYFTTPSPLLPPYTQPITTILGTTPITFSLSHSAGSLPPTGLTISPSGVLTGTPSTPGTYSFTVRATDVHGLFTEALYVLTV